MSCVRCGAPTPNRLCKPCAFDKQAEERFQSTFDEEGEDAD